MRAAPIKTLKFEGVILPEQVVRRAHAWTRRQGGGKPKYRLCAFCERSFPFTKKFFTVRSKRPWGLETICRQCNNAKALQPNKDAARRLRLLVLTAYGRNGLLQCCCCGELNEEFLTLDHKHGVGSKERRRLTALTLFRRLRDAGFPSGYQTLCWNCNLSYGLRGYCPHQRTKVGAN